MSLGPRAASPPSDPQRCPGCSGDSEKAAHRDAGWARSLHSSKALCFRRLQDVGAPSVRLSSCRTTAQRAPTSSLTPQTPLGLSASLAPNSRDSHSAVLPLPRGRVRSPQAPPALSGKMRSGQRRARASGAQEQAPGQGHPCARPRSLSYLLPAEALCGRDALRWRQWSGCGFGLGARSDRNLEGAGAGAGKPGSAHGRSLVALKSQLSSPAQLHCRLPPPLVLTLTPTKFRSLAITHMPHPRTPNTQPHRYPLLPPHLRTPTRATVMHTDRPLSPQTPAAHRMPHATLHATLHCS